MHGVRLRYTEKDLGTWGKGMVHGERIQYTAECYGIWEKATVHGGRLRYTGVGYGPRGKASPNASSSMPLEAIAEPLWKRQ